MGVAQLPDGLGGIELVVAGQVVDREAGHHGLYALFLRLLFHHTAHHAGRPDRQEHAHLLAARLVADHAGEIPEGHGLVGQNVSLFVSSVGNNEKQRKENEATDEENYKFLRRKERTHYQETRC